MKENNINIYKHVYKELAKDIPNLNRLLMRIKNDADVESFYQSILKKYNITDENTLLKNISSSTKEVESLGNGYAFFDILRNQILQNMMKMRSPKNQNKDDKIAFAIMREVEIIKATGRK